jgi:serine/threonine protein kinase
MLEFCPRRDLSDFVRSYGKFKIELARFYAAEILSALIYLQEKGVIHKDLKVKNNFYYFSPKI